MYYHNVQHGESFNSTVLKTKLEAISLAYNLNSWNMLLTSNYHKQPDPEHDCVMGFMSPLSCQLDWLSTPCHRKYNISIVICQKALTQVDNQTKVKSQIMHLDAGYYMQELVYLDYPGVIHSLEDNIKRRCEERGVGYMHSIWYCLNKTSWEMFTVEHHNDSLSLASHVCNITGSSKLSFCYDSHSSESQNLYTNIHMYNNTITEVAVGCNAKGLQENNFASHTCN